MTKTEWLFDMAKTELGRRPIAEITAPMILECPRKVEAEENFEAARDLRAKTGAKVFYAIATGPVRSVIARPLGGLARHSS